MRAQIRAALIALALFYPAYLSADDNLFRFQGLDYTESDLPPAYRQKLFEAKKAYYQALVDVMDGSALELYFEAVAEADGKDTAQVRNQLLGVARPSEQEVRRFFDQNRQRINGAYDQIRDRIAEHLHTRAVTAKSRALVTKLGNSGNFKVLIKKPVPPVVDIDTRGRPRKGAANAKATIVEFADYKCPHCKHAMSVLAGLVKQYQDEVSLVFMDFPVDRTGVSREIAKGAYCAQRQSRFWEYHDLAFRRQEVTDHQSPGRLAKVLGLDMTKFRTCLLSSAAHDAIAKSQAEGLRVGISATPTLYVNGERVFTENIEADVRAAIERAIAQPGG